MWGGMRREIELWEMCGQLLCDGLRSASMGHPTAVGGDHRRGLGWGGGDKEMR